MSKLKYCPKCKSLARGEYYSIHRIKLIDPPPKPRCPSCGIELSYRKFERYCEQCGKPLKSWIRRNEFKIISIAFFAYLLFLFYWFVIAK